MDDWDLFVVGAGSAGAVIAARVTEDPGWQVMLIDVGPDYPDRVSLPDDLAVVVDQYGRVFGVEGLYLADASIMPTIPRANIKHPHDHDRRAIRRVAARERGLV